MNRRLRGACRAVGKALVVMFCGAEVMGRYVVVTSSRAILWSEADAAPSSGDPTGGTAVIPGPRAAIPRPRAATPPEVRR